MFSFPFYSFMKYLIMHGSYGSPDGNWFRWLEKELSVSGYEVILEQFPVDDWETIEKIGPEKLHPIKLLNRFHHGKIFSSKQSFRKYKGRASDLPVTLWRRYLYSICLKNTILPSKKLFLSHRFSIFQTRPKYGNFTP